MSPSATSGESSASQTTFVCCVESGLLETGCVRMIESLRRHGGKLAESPVVAVKSRFGPPLSRSTRVRLTELGARFVEYGAARRYGWYHFLNKVLALVTVEDLVDSEQITFMDSDTLVVGEPHALLLSPTEDLTATPCDTGVVGTTGPDSRHDESWRRICRLLSVSVDDLPYVTTFLEGKRIRFYLNAGVYTYRRSSGFGRAYLEACLKVLDANEGFPGNGEHMLEQVTLGLVAFKLGLRWRILPYSHNYPVASFMAGQYERPDYDHAKILHYHDAMEATAWSQFMGHLERSHPLCHTWLAPLGPVTNRALLPWRLLSEALRVGRGLPRKLYRRRVCRLCGRRPVYAQG